LSWQRNVSGLIRGIADRGASSNNPKDVGYALQELSQVLLERTGEEDRVFEPCSTDELEDLDALCGELEFVDHSSESFETIGCGYESPYRTASIVKCAGGVGAGGFSNEQEERKPWRRT
jgi:hypothetical protein